MRNDSNIFIFIFLKVDSSAHFPHSARAVHTFLLFDVLTLADIDQFSLFFFVTFRFVLFYSGNILEEFIFYQMMFSNLELSRNKANYFG